MHALFLSGEFSHSLGTTETKRYAVQQAGHGQMRTLNPIPVVPTLVGRLNGEGDLHETQAEVSRRRIRAPI